MPGTDFLKRLGIDVPAAPGPAPLHPAVTAAASAPPQPPPLTYPAAPGRRSDTRYMRIPTYSLSQALRGGAAAASPRRRPPRNERIANWRLGVQGLLRYDTADGLTGRLVPLHAVDRQVSHSDDVNLFQTLNCRKCYFVHL